jgi:adenosylcobinamide-phosphate synthase
VSTTLRRRAVAVACGVVLDRCFGEPPAAIHPVAAFGSLMERIEQLLYRDTRSAGAAYATLGALVGYAAGSVFPTALVVAAASAGRELRQTASHVCHALAGDDVQRARTLLPSLVGRDTNALDRSGIAAAVIESVAENTVDAVVAPALWGLCAGGNGAAAYRTVNTMDAMVGHHSARYERFGWASARLDDTANFVPARVTALLVALVRPMGARRVARAAREQAPAHPSPNAGIAEGAFAAVLGVELGGPLRYGDRHEDRPRLGWGPRPQPGDIDRAVALASDVELALVGVLTAVAVLA